MQHDIKGTLARLLATENLVVEHKNVDTAQFNVESRVLTLPIWKITQESVYDALIAHEVGHALYTPLDKWFEQEEFVGVPHAFVNIIEDVRIEKLMKRRYEGLAKTFYRGYGQLNEDNFFEIDKPIDEFSFPDRINLNAKIGPFLCVEFTDTEQDLVDRIELAETFYEVCVLAKELQEFCKQQQEERIEEVKVKMNMDGSGNNDLEGEQETENVDAPSEESEGNDLEDLSEGLPHQQDDNGKYEPQPESASPEGSDEFDTSTVDALETKLQELVDTGAAESVYLELPKLHLDRIVVSPDEIRNSLNDHWKEEDSRRTEYEASLPKSYYESDDYRSNTRQGMIEKFEQFKKDSAKEVSYLVKEFECKKSASAYARATTSKTGVLDCTKLHTYKFNEDLFKKITVVPNGKNHGLVFILDWSGSMSNILLDTGKQLLQLIWFCKKVQIPFDVYAFSNEWKGRQSSYSSRTDLPPVYDRVANTIDIGSDFSLLNFVSSSSKDIDTDIKNLFLMCAYYDGWRNHAFTIPNCLSLSGTPLNESIICLNDLIPQFKNKTGVEKVNVVILTDGEAQSLRRNAYVDRHWESEPFLGTACINSNCFLRNRKTGKVTRFTHSYHEFTKLLLEDFRSLNPSVNVIGFRVLASRDASSFIRRYMYGTDDWGQIDKKTAEWRKNKSFSLENTGYQKYFALSSTSLNNEFDFDEETNDAMSKAEIKRAFVKSFKAKKTNKKVLNEFVDLVA